MRIQGIIYCVIPSNAAPTGLLASASLDLHPHPLVQTSSNLLTTRPFHIWVMLPATARISSCEPAPGRIAFTGARLNSRS